MVLVEGNTKYPGQLKGRTDTNRIAVFDSTAKVPEKIPYSIGEMIRNNSIKKEEFDNRIKDLKTNGEVSSIQKGDYVIVRCDDHSSRTLFCTPIAKATLSDFTYFANKRPFFVLDDYPVSKSF